MYTLLKSPHLGAHDDVEYWSSEFTLIIPLLGRPKVPLGNVCTWEGKEGGWVIFVLRFLFVLDAFVLSFILVSSTLIWFLLQGLDSMSGNMEILLRLGFNTRIGVHYLPLSQFHRFPFHPASHPYRFDGNTPRRPLPTAALFSFPLILLPGKRRTMSMRSVYLHPFPPCFFIFALVPPFLVYVRYLLRMRILIDLFAV